jgi:hypothetical protein
VIHCINIHADNERKKERKTNSWMERKLESANELI